MKARNLVAIPLTIALFLGALIYWREWDLRDQVPLYQVILWQLVIWSPWILGLKGLGLVVTKTSGNPHSNLWLLGAGLLAITLHFGWFFFISANFSPYIGQYGCRFGVFRYFFIFWTLLDLGLVGFVVQKLKYDSINEDKSDPPLLLELTRGNNTYFCEPSQIHLLASENYYTRLFTSEGVFLMRKPLKYFMSILPQELFKRIHRSTIINVNQVSELVRANDHSLEVIMRDGTRRRVSRSFVKEITHFFKERTA